MSVIKNISGLFFMASLIVVLYFVYVLFGPFWDVIFIAAAIVVSFYSWYEWLLKKLNGNAGISAALVCCAITCIVIVPLLLFLVYLSQSSLGALDSATRWIASGQIKEQVEGVRTQLGGFGSIENLDLNSYISDGLVLLNNLILSGLKSLARGTAELLSDLFLIILTMFFLFRDGKKLLQKIMKLTPLYDKYDREIFEQFKDVSYSAIVSTIITGIVQGITVAIALAIVGVPVLLLGIATVFASFIPFIGTFLVWGPVVLFLTFQGLYWQAVFMLLWGVFIVGVIDNLLRPYLMKGKTRIHPMILFFAIFGGLSLFGFWGIVFGPLIVAIALTLLHMYEMEYDTILYGTNGKTVKKLSVKPKKTVRKKSASTK